MSALRVLGFCYLAIASLFALAIASADQARLHDVLDIAGRTVSGGVDRSLFQPVLDFARVIDEQFFDPPQTHIAITLGPPGPDTARADTHVAVPAWRQTRLVDVPRPPLIVPLMIAPDLPPLEPEAAVKNDVTTDSRDESLPPSGAGVLVQARLERILTPELHDNFDLFLFVSKAPRGPSAQRLYVFKKKPDGALMLAYDWAASTGREADEISPQGREVFTATPRGIYQFDPDRMYRHYTSHAWNGEMPYAMFFNWERAGVQTGMAIHAATENSMAQLGKRASAGCVHISPEHAALLYKLIRASYRGQVPRFAYDAKSKTMNNRGALMRDAAGQIQMTEGYRVLIDVEDFSGSGAVASLY
jgi:L,D-transpeptidase catalytic domain